MSKVEITKAKNKGNYNCHYSIRTTIGNDTFDSGNHTSERIMHEHLQKAFAAVTIHMPLVLEELKPYESELDSLVPEEGKPFSEAVQAIISKYLFIGFDFDIENNKVSLIGTKEYELGILPITTFYIPLSGGNYKYEMELRVAMDTLRKEVLEYSQGKEAPQLKQGEMFATSTEDSLTVNGHPATPKKRGGGRKKVDSLSTDTYTVTIEQEPDPSQEEDDDFNKPLSAFFNPGGPNSKD